jgi:hypothetical protein
MRVHCRWGRKASEEAGRSGLLLRGKEIFFGLPGFTLVLEEEGEEGKGRVGDERARCVSQHRLHTHPPQSPHGSGGRARDSDLMRCRWTRVAS